MPMCRLSLTSLLAFAMAAAAPVAAAAAEPASEASSQRATELFRKGQARFDARDFSAALPLFQEAWQLSKSPNARLYVARCLAELGRNVQAYTELSGVIVDTTATNEERYERTREAAQAELAEANQRVAKLVITLDQRPAGFTILLDDAPVAQAQLGIPIILEPGEHRLLARAEGSADFSELAQLGAGQSRTIHVTFAPAHGETAPPPATATTAERSSSGMGTWQTAGLVGAGVGIVALGVFATTGFMAKSKYDAVSDACGGQRCSDDSHADEIDSGRSLQTVANVSLVVGSLALVAGGSLYFFGPKPSPSQVGAYVLPSGGFATYRTRF